MVRTWGTEPDVRHVPAKTFADDTDGNGAQTVSDQKTQKKK